MGLVLYHASDISVDFGKRDKLLSQRANAKFLAGKKQPAILSTLDNLFVHACNRQFHLLGYRPLVDDPAPDSATKITQIPGVLLHQRGSLGLDPIRLDPQLRGQRRLACFTWVRRHRNPLVVGDMVRLPSRSKSATRAAHLLDGPILRTCIVCGCLSSHSATSCLRPDLR